jgi:hypothetical protein
MKMFNASLKAATNPVDFVMGIVVISIVIAAAAIPTITTVLASSNITGVPATILATIPTFLGLLVLVLIARGMS